MLPRHFLEAAFHSLPSRGRDIRNLSGWKCPGWSLNGLDLVVGIASPWKQTTPLPQSLGSIHWTSAKTMAFLLDKPRNTGSLKQCETPAKLSETDSSLTACKSQSTWIRKLSNNDAFRHLRNRTVHTVLPCTKASVLPPNPRVLLEWSVDQEYQAWLERYYLYKEWTSKYLKFCMRNDIETGTDRPPHPRRIFEQAPRPKPGPSNRCCRRRRCGATHRHEPTLTLSGRIDLRALRRSLPGIKIRASKETSISFPQVMMIPIPINFFVGLLSGTQLHKTGIYMDV